MRINAQHSGAHALPTRSRLWH